MISIAAFWMNRDSEYAEDWTSEIQYNGAETVRRWNLVLDKFTQKTHLCCDEVASGWRPIAVNSTTSNAGMHSNHITAKACDIRDTQNRDLAQWCLDNQNFLEEIGMWMEDPRWTPTWVHLQTIPPASRKRVYVPSTKPPLCPALKGQNSIPVRIKL